MFILDMIAFALYLAILSFNFIFLNFISLLNFIFKLTFHSFYSTFTESLLYISHGQWAGDTEMDLTVSYLQSQCNMSCMRCAHTRYSGEWGEVRKERLASSEEVQEVGRSGDNCLYSLLSFLIRAKKLILDNGISQSYLCLVFKKREVACRIFSFTSCPPLS